MVTDCLSRPPAMEGLHVAEDTTVCYVLTEWLLVVAPHLDFNSCILSAIVTLHASMLT